MEESFNIWSFYGWKDIIRSIMCKYPINICIKFESTFPGIGAKAPASNHITRGSRHAGKIRALSAHFRTHSYREAGPALAPSRRQGRALCQAGGLQLGP